MPQAQPVQSPSDDAPPPYSEPSSDQQTFAGGTRNTSVGNPSHSYVKGQMSASITRASSSSTPLQQDRNSSNHRSPYAFIPRRVVSTSPITNNSTARPQHSVQGPSGTDVDRVTRKQIARETLAAISLGGYSVQGVRHPLVPRIRAMCSAVEFIAPQAAVSLPKRKKNAARTIIEVVDMTTLDAVRWLERDAKHNLDRKEKKGGLWDFGVDNEKYDSRFSTGQNGKRIGVLTSASPYMPGGGFRAGDAGQELSVARASTLSVALESAAARPFYDQRSRGKDGVRTASLNPPYHTHALVYAPNVTVFRDERGGWTPPLDIDVVTCAAVHACDAHDAVNKGAPLTHDEVTARIHSTMTARLSRVLSMFARHHISVLVLPAFGAGSFNNSPARISSIFGHLFLENGAPFKDVFDRVVFAVPGCQARVFEEVLSAMDAKGRVRVHKPAELPNKLNADGIFDMSGLRANLDDNIPKLRSDKNGKSDENGKHAPPIGTSTTPSTSFMPAHRPRIKTEPNKITVGAHNGVQTLTLSYGGAQGLEEDDLDNFNDDNELDGRDTHNEESENANNMHQDMKNTVQSAKVTPGTIEQSWHRVLENEQDGALEYVDGE